MLRSACTPKLNNVSDLSPETSPLNHIQIRNPITPSSSIAKKNKRECKKFVDLQQQSTKRTSMKKTTTPPRNGKYQIISS